MFKVFPVIHLDGQTDQEQLFQSRHLHRDHEGEQCDVIVPGEPRRLSWQGQGSFLAATGLTSRARLQVLPLTISSSWMIKAHGSPTWGKYGSSRDRYNVSGSLAQVLRSSHFPEARRHMAKPSPAPHAFSPSPSQVQTETPGALLSC